MTVKMLGTMTMVGCFACSPTTPNPAPDAPEPSRTDVLTIQGTHNPDLDLLFVIDDSPSMIEKQASLKSAFPALIAQLARLPGGTPNLHIGVISTDMGTKGSAVMAPGAAIGQVGNGGCAGTGKGGALQTSGAAINGTFLKANRDGTTNFTGALSDVFSQVASLGAGGCGFEQPLAAMRAAFVNPANTGFVRASANLAVIVLSDEDDCSVRDPALFGPMSAELGPLQSFRCFKFGVECSPDDPDTASAKTGCHPRASSLLIDDVAPFKDALLAAKGGDARKVMFGAIIGDPTSVGVEPRTPPGGGAAILALAHSCTYPSGGAMAVADPGVRLAAMAGAFPGRWTRASVCNDNLTSAVAEMGQKLARLVGDGCLERAITTPTDCVVVDVRDSAPDIEIALPSCGADISGDCYELVSDATCTDGSQLRLQVTRAQPPAPDTWTSVRCVTGG